MKKGFIKSITNFIQKIIGALYKVADKHADGVVLAIEWLQGVIEGNEAKATEVVKKTKTKLDDQILKAAIEELPGLLKNVKEVQVLVDGTETPEEFWEKVRGKITLEANEKRKFYTDLAASLLMKFVKVPDWIAIIITQFAFGRIFKTQ